LPPTSWRAHTRAANRRGGMTMIRDVMMAAWCLCFLFLPLGFAPCLCDSGRCKPHYFFSPLLSSLCPSLNMYQVIGNSISHGILGQLTHRKANVAAKQTPLPSWVALPPPTPHYCCKFASLSAFHGALGLASSSLRRRPFRRGMPQNASRPSLLLPLLHQPPI
jgi:hypothetical protein